MRVLLLNSYFDEPRGGGTEVVLTILAQGLTRLGHEVCVVSTRADPGSDTRRIDGVQCVKLGIHNVYWPLNPQPQPGWKRLLWHAIDRFNPRAAREVTQIARDFNPDIISVHNVSGFSVAVWPQLKRLGVPMTQMLHDYQLICAKTTMFDKGHICERQCGACAMFRGPHRKATAAADAVIACSQAVLNIHRREGYFLDVPLQVVIPHARTLRGGAVAGGSVPPRRDGVLTFGFIGSITQIKGVEPLLQAFLQLDADATVPMRLLVAGTGKDDDMQRLRRDYRRDNIHFLGRVDPAAFYPVLDVAVVPSLSHDTFPFVVYEALSCGVPVIGSRRGGIPEVVQHERTGLIFDPDRPGALLDAMRRLATSPATRQAMSALGPASVVTLTDEGRFVRDHETLYLKLIAQRRLEAVSPAAGETAAELMP